MTKNESDSKERLVNNDQNYAKLLSDETNKKSNYSLNNNNINNIRKDAKGNPITKKKLFIKTKHHAYLKDELIPGQSITNVVEIPSYKQYNMDSDIIEEEDEEQGNNEMAIDVNREVKHCQCCCTF